MSERALRTRLIRLAHENAKIRPLLLPLLKEACGCEGPTMGKFEEGKPADPTENMTEEQKKEWWKNHEKNKDKFKGAGRREDPNRVVFMITTAITGPLVVNITNNINKKYPYDGTPEGLAATLQEAATTALRFQSMDILDGPEINVVKAPRVPPNLAQTVFNRTTVVVGAVYVALQSKSGLEWVLLPRAPKVASVEETAKFEKGKPADPTENMTEEQKKEWWKNHEKNKDKFKGASKKGVGETKAKIRLASGMVIPQGTLVEAVDFERSRPSLAKLHIAGQEKPVSVSAKNLYAYLEGYEMPPSRAEMQKMVKAGKATTPSGAKAPPDGWAEDGTPSWLVVLGYA